jgi:hypothetical protein
VLRDHARISRLLGHDGAWEGKQIVPAQWMIDANVGRFGSMLSKKSAGPSTSIQY